MKLRPAYKDKRQNVILVQDRVSKTNKHSLRPALRARRITPWSRDIQPIYPNAVVINFGGGALPAGLGTRRDLHILNPPDKVAISSNKLRTFEFLQKAEVPCVRWTTSRDEVGRWLDKGHKVLARTNLQSSGGRAISVFVQGQQVVDAPLWTRYFPKTHEFRVHVVNGKAIDLTEKKLREELKEKRDAVSLVRSHDNGWVHAHSDLSLTDKVDLGRLMGLATDAISAVGLDFGAVDILACLDTASPRRLTKAVVCEVNSAPGIENEATKKAYVDAFNALIKEKASGVPNRI
jgi:hypothetical protein